jgi:hypothetical protein
VTISRCHSAKDHLVCMPPSAASLFSGKHYQIVMFTKGSGKGYVLYDLIESQSKKGEEQVTIHIVGE